MPEGQYFLAGGIDLLQFLIISAELIAVQQEIDRDVICIPELAGLDSTLYYLPHLMITPASLIQVTVESIMNTATCLPAGCNQSTLFKLSNNAVQWFQRSIYKTRDIDRHYMERFLS